MDEDSAAVDTLVVPFTALDEARAHRPVSYQDGRLSWDLLPRRQSPLFGDTSGANEEADCSFKSADMPLESDSALAPCWPANFNLADYEKSRAAAQVHGDFCPNTFRIGLKPLPSLANLSPTQFIKSVSELSTAVPEDVIALRIVDEPFTQETETFVLNAIMTFTNIQIINLRNTGLRQIRPLTTLQSVRYADFSQNNLTNTEHLRLFLCRNKFIDSLNVSENIAFDTQPVRLQIVQSAPYLKYLNGHVIDNEFRAQAFSKLPPDNKQSSGLVLWDCAFMQSSAMRFMKYQWDPSAVTSLDLSKSSLTEFHVAPFTKLKELRLSFNKISSIKGAGLEKLSDLALLDLSNNLLSDLNELIVFRFTPSLRTLFLAHNPLPDDYRLLVIFHTRLLKGTPQCYGLDRLDDVPVTIHDRLTAYTSFSHAPPSDIAKEHYSLVLSQTVSHALTHSPLISTIVSLRLVNVGLEYVDVSVLTGLLDLDVSGNNVTEITGLEKCERVEKVRCTGNRKLDRKRLVGQVGGLRKMEDVWRDEEENGAVRMSELSLLLKTLTKLRSLDGKTITADERIAAMQYKSNKEQDLKYRVALRVLENVSISGIDYSPNSILKGDNYDKSLVYYLPNLNNLGLTNTNIIPLDQFNNVVYLNLSHNNLTTLKNIGLESLSNLLVLDASDNNITDTPREIASLIDACSSLDTVSIRHNPCIPDTTFSETRAAILTNIKRLLEEDCHFKILDTEITLDERMSIWQHSGLDKTLCDLRHGNAMILKKVGNETQATLKVLDMSGLKISALDVSSMPALEELYLQGNKIVTLRNVKGLQSLVQLKILNVRQNQLRESKEVLELLQTHDTLRQVLWKENPGYISAHEILNVIKLSKERKFSLEYLDETFLPIDDIVNSQKKFDAMEAEKLRLYLTLWRMGFTKETLRKERKIDLSNSQLIYINITLMPKMMDMILAGNKLDASLFRQPWQNMKYLRVLDLQRNSISSLSAITSTIENIKSLEQVFILQNPCYEKENYDNRLRFLQKTRSLHASGCRLSILNGVPIEIRERVEAVSKLNQPTSAYDAERLRILLHLEKIGVTKYTDEIDLSRCKIGMVLAIHSFTNLQRLNLSKNNISTLKDSKLYKLPFLTYLNISNNAFTSVDDIIQYLRLCPKLQELNMEKCGPQIDNYFEYVTHYLRGVSVLDGVPSMLTLSEVQIQAVDYFSELANNESARIAYNNCLSVDLSGLGLKTKDVMQIVRMLGSLPIERLRLINNPLTGYNNYRLLVIYYVKSLKELDGEKVELEERANAIRVFKNLQDEVNEQGMIKVPHSSAAKRKSIGSILTKLEIAVSYIQVFGLIYGVLPPQRKASLTFVRALGTPLQVFSLIAQEFAWRDWKWPVVAVAIIVLPLIYGLYHAKFSQKRLMNIFDNQWKRTLLISYISWIVTAISVIIYAVTAPPSMIPSQGVFMQRSNLVSLILSFFTFVFIIVMAFGVVIRRNSSSATFWYDVTRIQRRCALFILTIAYTPLNKIVLQYFVTCSPSDFECMATNRAASLTPRTVSEIPVTWWFLVPLGVATIFVIPAFLVRLIRRGVRQIELNYGIENEDKKLQKAIMELKQIQGPEKIAQKKRIAKQKRSVNILYAIYAREHEAAFSYLYCSYKRNCRYWKIFLMGQRLVLLIIILFAGGRDKIVATFATCLIMALLTIITQPFADSYENVLEIASQSSNSLISMAFCLREFGRITDSSVDVISIISFTMLVAALLVVLGSLPLRRRRKNSNDKTFRAKKEFLFVSSGKGAKLKDYIVSTLGSHSLHEAVKLPPTESKNDWLAVNTVDFFNQLNVIYGGCADNCTAQTCPVMTAGKFEFLLWPSPKNPKPVKCSAKEYITAVFEHVENELDNPEVFSRDGNFPKDFERNTIRTIFKRLFRVYAHLYHSHLQQFQNSGEAAHLNTCFKHFIYFVKEFDLIDKTELRPLDDVINQLIK